MDEPLKKEGETPPPRAPVKPDRKLAGVRRGKTLISALLGELDDGTGTDTSVQMVMKKNFGKGTDKFFSDAHGCGDSCKESHSTMG
jgi:hypothetical protein